MSTQEARQMLSRMNDADTVRFLKHLGNSLFAGTPREAILGGIDAEAKKLDEVRRLLSLDDSARRLSLGADESVAVARSILGAMADDETLAPALVSARREFTGEELLVDAILASGFVSAMLLFLATTEVEGKIGAFAFKKGRASAKLVQTITSPFLGILGKRKETEA